jgi:predicted RNA binding protein YcfA (HicA-like mRNA interferase family)
MPRLPRVSAREVVAALRRAGFMERRQTGSHLTMHDPTTGTRVIVPMHGGDMKVGTVHDIIQRAGLTVEQFIELLG